MKILKYESIAAFTTTLLIFHVSCAPVKQNDVIGNWCQENCQKPLDARSAIKTSKDFYNGLINDVIQLSETAYQWINTTILSDYTNDVDGSDGLKKYALPRVPQDNFEAIRRQVKVSENNRFPAKIGTRMVNIISLLQQLSIHTYVSMSQTSPFIAQSQWKTLQGHLTDVICNIEVITMGYDVKTEKSQCDTSNVSSEYRYARGRKRISDRNWNFVKQCLAAFKYVSNYFKALQENN